MPLESHKKVDGQKYIGQGRSKKIARIQAAEAALRSFIQFKDGTTLSPIMNASTNLDFTSDEHIENGLFESCKLHILKFLLFFPLHFCLYSDQMVFTVIFRFHRIEMCSVAFFSFFHSLKLETVSKNLINKKQVPEKGPVMLLYELFNDVSIDCVASDGVQHSRFKMVATVNNQRFEGTGKQTFNSYYSRIIQFSSSKIDEINELIINSIFEMHTN